ncbi:hypothetical protein PC122_g10179 [Phytophthora cactorum]|nr:hypothetical protein PC122_g10179 [Phytophthora cactorum]
MGGASATHYRVKHVVLLGGSHVDPWMQKLSNGRSFSAVFAWHSDFVTNNWRVTAISADLDGVSVQTVGINDNFVDQAIIDVELGQEVDVRAINKLDPPT